ncbi:hypothetical protein JX265_012380 [Neoarthrinium moseri]|uniref:Zn(2)-C6 fungal-type domain-containing protein n=1 Tax=Neoarthrinium moseri TaxID=1658444 RepID=A0A9P9WAI7_9PEZI|nr:uncharacterized protein JN550_011172 [Neoarthrinium moseri]KAI1851538.1 hypothetical protein JX266_003000 [Neoarthrinium moseri]KAI1855025.1 hypothetical protein JX265_012380 [Neoarthrinium moseri]KAI1860857.1 hypothetical protein JN550_011172 [Neoarthrinium moseri]
MSETVASGPDSDTRDDERLAACFNCKRSKLKCVRTAGSSVCTRCRQRRIECAAPAYHVGRHKGVKNKHTGLEKAVHQIEQALRRSSAGHEQIQSQEQANELRYLLERSRELLASGDRSGVDDYATLKSEEQDQRSSPNRTPTSLDTPPSQLAARDHPPMQKGEGDQLSLDDAENPLQLLARTSELLSAIQPRAPNGVPGHTAFKYASRNDNDLQKFFGPYQPRLDVGDDLDPVELGLITLAEAEALFSYFYDKLAHTRWGIDPVIHTVDFVRSRSSFLLTSIAAASALFSPSLESLYKRLSNHRQKLAGIILSKQYKSVEIVLAFMVNIPWISAGDHWADDETSTWLSMALTIALDISLNKIILPSSCDPHTPRDGVATADCITARKALLIDGFGDIDPASLPGRRLLRRRERTWLSLFVLERGVCLARGRDYVLPMSPLIESCDQWHLSELADRWDGSIVSVAVLRRDLANLIARVRAICDGYVDNNDSEAAVVERLKTEITLFFDRWYQTWPLQIGDRELAARHYFRAAGLSSALNVLRVAVQGENQLKSMPNNTAIMISCAACFALRVGTVADARGSSLAPSIRTLITETTDVLERIGSTPIQRKGLSCIFARQLRQILKLASRSADNARSHAAPSREATTAPVFPDINTGNVHHTLPVEMPPSTMPSDYPLFSTMSNVQLDEAINNTDVGLESLWEDFQFQNGADLDWMDWSTFA